MSFPTDIKGCMSDCILAIFWPRKDIYKFFEDHDCTKTELLCINDFKEKELSRIGMIDVMFGKLAARSDGGLGTFRAMLQSLVKWDHFDKYYFDKLKKLSREEALKCISHLCQRQEL